MKAAGYNPQPIFMVYYFMITTNRLWLLGRTVKTEAGYFKTILLLLSTAKSHPVDDTCFPLFYDYN